MSKSLRHGFKIFMIVASAPFMLAAQDASGALRDIADEQVDLGKLQEAVASRTLTWLTGSSSNNDYISVGRMANLFGFVALRVSSGQSLSRSGVAKHTLATLDYHQLAELVSLLDIQKTAYQQTQRARFEMNRALEGLLVGEETSREDFLKLGRTYGAAEANLGRVIAQRLGDIVQTLSDAQKDQLLEIRDANISGRGDKISLKQAKLKLAKDYKKELVNLAARFLSWSTGSEAFNDFEVVGKPSQHFGFVSLRIESNHGVKRGHIAKEVTAILSPVQTAALKDAARHNVVVFDEFLMARAQLMRSLEVALAGHIIDSEKVTQFGRLIGQLEADMTWAQAQGMLAVRDEMTDDQSRRLLGIRAKYTSDNANDLPIDPFERGRQLYAQCELCHAVSGQESVGPNLSGIVGRGIATDTDFLNYTPALTTFSQRNEVWDDTLLDQFLKSPKGLVPGTIMGFDGFDNLQDRVALITYLKAREK